MFGFGKRKKEQDDLFEQFKEMLSAEMDNESNYLDMSSGELIELSDEELCSAIEARTENKVEEYEEISDGIKALSDVEKNFYICRYYEMEVSNGGLCQFFVNSSRELAPFLSESLDMIGADGHKKLFDEFINENNIDLSNLSSFIIRSEKDFEKQYKRYPFENFDYRFYELEPLEEILVAYIRKNIGEL